MTSCTTAYGPLEGIEFRTLFSNGKTDGCMVSRKNILDTPYGKLVPQYQAEDMGRRPVKPLYFYKSGAIKSMALQEQTFLETSVGKVPAELVSFHESGSIRRIFPLDGKLSGFWTARNEFELAGQITIESPAGPLSARFIGLQFYESGSLKSVTLWPGEALSIPTPAGTLRVRTGIAFYEDGALRSVEPAGIARVETPVGVVTAYDNDPQGIHGDINSLQFDRDGSIAAFMTTSEEFFVVDRMGGWHRFAPSLKDNPCGVERKVVVPLKVRISGGRIMFEGYQQSFDMERNRIRVRPYDRKAADRPGYSCAS
jgi:hypothetical protein